MNAQISRPGWIFSPAIDLWVFLGSAGLSITLWLVGGWLGGETVAVSSPQWSWLLAVLLVDVAHVWSTAFVVYLDAAELRRRPGLYIGAPLAAWVVGIAIYHIGDAELFWRIVAYLAVFHFVRQQYGWVMMARGSVGECDRLGRWLDGATIYATTVVPLILWHTQLPRNFWWMREGDFITGVPTMVGDLAIFVYVVLGTTYAVRAVGGAVRAVRNRGTHVPWTKHIVVVTSALCWYLGIVATNSDYAFTVTNVFLHGIPYAALIYLYARRAAARPESARSVSAGIVRRGLLPFLASLWAVAYLEELLWDRMIWHDHPSLFGNGPDLDSMAALLVPLLAVPQLTHYLLDGFLWRRASNPRLGALMRPGAPSSR
jgi:hypothetical protein